MYEISRMPHIRWQLGKRWSGQRWVIFTLNTIQPVMYQKNGHMSSKPDCNVKQASGSSFIAHVTLLKLPNIDMSFSELYSCVKGHLQNKIW